MFNAIAGRSLNDGTRPFESQDVCRFTNFTEVGDCGRVFNGPPLFTFAIKPQPRRIQVSGKVAPERFASFGVARSDLMSVADTPASRHACCFCPDNDVWRVILEHASYLHSRIWRHALILPSTSAGWQGVMSLPPFPCVLAVLRLWHCSHRPCKFLKSKNSCSLPL